MGAAGPGGHARGGDAGDGVGVDGVGPEAEGEFDSDWAKTVGDGLIAWLNEHYTITAIPDETNGCGCWTCVSERAAKISDFPRRLGYLSRMIVCPDCGNKRCPQGHVARERLHRLERPGAAGLAVRRAWSEELLALLWALTGVHAAVVAACHGAVPVDRREARQRATCSNRSPSMTC